MNTYRARLDGARARVGPPPSDRFTAGYQHEWWALEWNERRHATMRKLAAGTDQADEVDTLIAEFRQEQNHRPRLQQELDGTARL